MRAVLIQIAIILLQLAASLRDEKDVTKLQSEVASACKPHEMMGAAAVLPKDRFQNVSCLGHGTFGTVYYAEDTHHGNLPVAVKVAKLSATKQLCNHECEIIQRMMRGCTPPTNEGCMGATSIMRCLEQSPLDSQGDWMVMELGGKMLATVFKEGLGPMWNMALLKSFVAQLVEAFEFMARKHVTHGDFLQHWGNMVVADLYTNPKIKIVDFGLASSGDGESIRSVVDHYFWFLMHLPLGLRDNCVRGFIQQLKVLLFGGLYDEPQSLTYSGESGTSVDDMVTCLLEANDDAGYAKTLRSATREACHDFNGQVWGPVSSLKLPSSEESKCSDNLPNHYCEASFMFKHWLLDHWNRVCKKLGKETCKLRPARDIATFIVAFWSFLFDAYDSLNEHWDACAQCFEGSGGRWCNKCKVKANLNKMFPNGTIECSEGHSREYLQDMDCKVTPSGGEDLVARKICSRMCVSNIGDSVESLKENVKGQPCCVVTEEVKNLEQEDYDEEDGYWPNMNLNLLTTKSIDADMSAFPTRDVRNMQLLEMWNGVLMDPDGLSFLRMLLNGGDISSQNPFLKGARPEVEFDERMVSYPPKMCSERS